ncbi:dienelactone hydrolase [Bradyrhizobium sp. LM2.7]
MPAIIGECVAFHADYRGSYRKDAAEDAWKRVQAWLKKYGVLS